MSIDPPVQPRQQSSTPPCAACKFLRRKCQSDCIFSPYFPSDQQPNFYAVHKAFGASNVSKHLHRVPPHLRARTAEMLIVEAHIYLRDPVHGALGIISGLQNKLQFIEMHLREATLELAKYQAIVGAAANPPDRMFPIQAPPDYNHLALARMAFQQGDNALGRPVIPGDAHNADV